MTVIRQLHLIHAIEHVGKITWTPGRGKLYRAMVELYESTE